MFKVQLLNNPNTSNYGASYKVRMESIEITSLPLNSELRVSNFGKRHTISRQVEAFLSSCSSERACESCSQQEST